MRLPLWVFGFLMVLIHLRVCLKFLQALANDWVIAF
uniref:Uncharacterized protein n=1 Tax=Leviviridae sp. TaxID=2027243 RepID=A0A514D701_9VIRU|nr:MAG: hypothetical protein H3BulkLitter172403_000002 [Leviviridae sp.]